MPKVNLDALIPREDFEITENLNPGRKKETISVEDLKADSFFFLNVRKPDFQRETNEWDSKKICGLITSFLEGDLIPAIILWRSTSGYLFVIDGSHRLSALSAWINDDYGDGDISKKFYDGVIPSEQKKIAEETRKTVNKAVGSYQDLRNVLTQSDIDKPEVVKYAKNLAALAIQLQWVEGDASKAESSYFKINQEHAPIDKTELKLLGHRRKPNSIAARAIIKGGKGHKYWSSFSDELQGEIQIISEEINNILFEPKLETPIKTLDVPIAGKLYSAQSLSLILDLVNVVNGIDFDNKGLDDDKTGEATLKLLKGVRKIVWQLNSNHSSSLGLHPIVYFYSKDGRYRTVSFLALVDFLIELNKKNKINAFIEARKEIETIIVRYNHWIKQIYEKHRNNQKGYKSISKLLQQILIHLNNCQQIEEVVREIISSPDFKYLTDTYVEPISEPEQKDFGTSKKSEIYIRDALPAAPRCKICQGFIHKNSISVDHIQRKQDGGLGNIDNGQLTHPYCNTGYKESKI